MRVTSSTDSPPELELLVPDRIDVTIVVTWYRPCDEMLNTMSLQKGKSLHKQNWFKIIVVTYRWKYGENLKGTNLWTDWILKCLETSVKDFLLADNILHSARTESSAGTFSHMGINSSTFKKIPIRCLFTSKWFLQIHLNLPPLCCRFWLRLVPPAHFLPPRFLLRLPKKKWKWKHIRRYNCKKIILTVNYIQSIHLKIQSFSVPFKNSKG